jgi:hypothetical protein
MKKFDRHPIWFADSEHTPRWLAKFLRSVNCALKCLLLYPTGLAVMSNVFDECAKLISLCFDIDYI